MRFLPPSAKLIMLPHVCKLWGTAWGTVLCNVAAPHGRRGHPELVRSPLPAQPIQIERRTLRPHLAIHAPVFAHPSVLVREPWEYVALHLRRNGFDDALFFWQQAQALYVAVSPLPPTASPITAYYCCLNAAKALLAAKKKQMSPYHGLSGSSVEKKGAALKNEEISIKSDGVFRALSDYFGDSNETRSVTLYQVLQSLVYVHRAFCLTFRSANDLFLPLENARFVRKHRSKKSSKESSKDSWFCAEVPSRYWHHKILEAVPTAFEIERGGGFERTIRFKRRFDWEPKDQEASLKRLKRYNQATRRHLCAIVGHDVRWYLRRVLAEAPSLTVSELPLTLAGLHRLSELARYEPLKLNKHLSAQHGWLLLEFLRISPSQFVFQIASELTGLYFYRPGTATITPHLANG